MQKLLIEDSRIIRNGLQAQVGKDQRLEVDNIFQHPFNCIGKLLCKIKDHQGKQQISYGTAGIVGKNLIITSVHVIYMAQIKSFADQITFYYPCLKNGKIQSYPIKVNNYTYNKKYFEQNNKARHSLDYAILQLQKNQIIQQSHILQLNFDYQHSKYPNSKINISGYSLFSSNHMYYQQKPAYKQQKQFLLYKHTTSISNSGTPILLKSQNQNKYQMIGIHKGNIGNFNYCVLLSSLKPQEKQYLDTYLRLLKYPQNWQRSKARKTENIKIQIIEKGIQKQSEQSQIQNWKQKCELLQAMLNSYRDIQKDKLDLEKKLNLQIKSNGKLKLNISQLEKPANTFMKRQAEYERLVADLNKQIEKLNNILRNSNNQIQAYRAKIVGYQKTLNDSKLNQQKIKDYQNKFIVRSQQIQRLNNYIRQSNDKIQKLQLEASKVQHLENTCQQLQIHNMILTTELQKLKKNRNY